jgi:hypothetical protein
MVTARHAPLKIRIFVHHQVSSFIEVPQIIFQIGDQPDPVVDLTYANGLTKEYGA